MFQQDKNLKHTLKATKEFLRDNILHILSWPPLSFIRKLSQQV